MRAAPTTPPHDKTAEHGASPAPPPPPPPPLPPASANPSAKSVPLRALNRSITEGLTGRSLGGGGGRRARPGETPRPLPRNYQSVARRVTMTIVALPVALVTSWVLWDRLVLGTERKSLVHDPPVVPGPPMAAEMEAARRNAKE
ncbi:hypothetical protein DSL72_002042 [Monilinia vaccinii-corymbosi]|uniref:Uncharacterized protein n=1 Tax=Monilinia vaccinii-corymbosi TaxID=61207 RepID=A0A8A3PBM3_9HELO|nr:hypothetical protein DSL72_002042 [Monilinia vaccinii-corymbosi]